MSVLKSPAIFDSMGSEEDAANRVGGRNHSAMFDTAKKTTISDLWRTAVATDP